ncbi:MAG TPA: lipopolysaccharide kinase InaA family protein [Gemmataceae bacterium]|nr:lipopolysaccharide kinase InaA family protein [Gemmataceae bacterium]
MAYLEINPRYQPLLRRLGLRAPEDFLALPAVIISGHPDRNVSRLTLEDEGATFPAFLKREHCIRSKDRVLNALAGFGWVSKSWRECAMLQAFARARIGCPEWIAAGEDEQGRSFLLLRELAEVSDLRVHLRDHLRAHPRARRRFALRLGGALAQLHEAGFDHPDLYSKHILVNHDGASIYFLDLQRCQRRRSVPWRQRWRDLAALEATLTDELFPTPDRIACLRAYLRIYRAHGGARSTNPLHSAYQVFRQSARLACHRRIQEILQGPRSDLVQQLIWVDGERLCVTPALQARLKDNLPDELKLTRLPERPRQFEFRQNISVDPFCRATLVRRRSSHFLRGLWNYVCGRRFASLELRQAATLFRLQRAGIQTPELLAFGQRRHWLGGIESFLLTEVAPTVSLKRWCAVHASLQRAGITPRRQVIRQTAQLLQRLHRAHCYLGTTANGEAIQICTDARPTGIAELAVVLQTVEGLIVRRRTSKRMIEKDLRIIQVQLREVFTSRTDVLRFLHTYFACRRLNPEIRRLARSFLRAPGPQDASLGPSATAATSLPLTGRSAAA